MKKIYFSTIILLFSGSMLLAQDVTFNGDLGPTGTGAIPDGGGAANQGLDAKCTVTGVGTLKDLMFVKVTIDITHPYVSDLTIDLISPGGIKLNLADDIGDAGDNFKNTRFTQTATLKINDKDGGANPPYNGEFLPQEDEGLPKFNSINADGVWTLHVQDNFPIDNGSLTKWSLTFNKNPIVKPTANFSYTADFLNVNFKNESSDTTSSFVWDFGDGDSSTLVSPTHSYLDSGTYTVKLIATNIAGQDSSIQEIHIEKEEIPIGMNSTIKNQFSVYPNPFSKNLIINTRNPSIGLLEIRNALGQLVLEPKVVLSEKEIQLNTENYSPGIYTIIFRTTEGISIGKVIK